mmetsp:Transcript_27847/g.56049  ORF Transcript_27847/g.56049 Transcript_27847/m.56049 type:complete len:171 (-) Transcript_27847:186-698(-)
MLRTLNVTHIVNASRNQSNPFCDSISYCSCAVADSTEADISAVLEATYWFISAALEESPDSVILVHCSRGISRSVAIVAGFLMRSFALSFHESIDRIRRSHPAAEPNDGFVAQLQAREQDWGSQSRTASSEKMWTDEASCEKHAPWDMQERWNAKRLIDEAREGWVSRSE